LGATDLEKPLIFLVANRNSTLLKGFPIVLNGGITVKQISSDHLGMIIGFKQSLSTIVNPKKKCFLVPHDHECIKNGNFADIHIALSFALTFFSKKGAITCDRIFRIEKKKKSRISEEIILSNRILAAQANDMDFKISSTTTPQEIDLIFKSCIKSIESEKHFRITLERYISASIVDDSSSKIIDISICLESLFPGRDEIKYRFSLYNSLISTAEHEKRAEIYELMRLLYDARSAIVHGGEVKQKEKIDQNWDKILDVAKLSIAYKMNFLATNNASGWDAHLSKLALGIEQRLN